MTGSAPVARRPANPDCDEAQAVSENSNSGIDSESKATVAADAGRDAEVLASQSGAPSALASRPSVLLEVWLLVSSM